MTRAKLAFILNQVLFQHKKNSGQRSSMAAGSAAGGRVAGLSGPGLRVVLVLPAEGG